jgi:uridine phosphorylase
MEAKPIFIEMESDTVFLVGAKRGFRTGALFTSDGTAEEIKPEEGKEAFVGGVDESIIVALKAMRSIALKDRS